MLLLKWRTDLINFLIQKNNYKSYLEIGLEKGDNFQCINCDKKVSVDPDTATNATFHLESDAFFAQNEDFFDIIFIDGLHHCDQVYKDIKNSLKFLKEGGTIVCHDMNPFNRELQEVPQKPNVWWTGDCWKAWVKLRSEESDLNMRVLDMDFGCGVITRGSQKKIWLHAKAENLDYSYLNFDRKYLLNLISVEEFVRNESNN